MRTGSCGYGSKCKFHHPDRTDVTGIHSHNSNSKGKSTEDLNYTAENCNGELNSLQGLRLSDQTAASLSSHVALEHHVLFSNHSARMNALPQEDHLNSKCNNYQVGFSISVLLLTSCSVVH